jgi:(p)ppGpp synthase/HD superfamily hydrolase
MKIVESYNTDESFLYDKTYLFIKGYATALNLNYTLKALPLVRKFHNGQYRKGEVIIDGKSYKLPYVLHVLKVCSTIISLHLPLTNDELDILLSAALLHDSIEDCKEYFPMGDTDLISIYGFPKEVYNIVTSVSKRSGATEEELDEYFDKIKKNRLALTIKLADRSHNVEDLYVMKPEKLHKYVKETREYVYPLATYGKANYPELSNGFTILKAKIVSLTECTETLINIYESELETLRAELKEKDKIIANLKKNKES